MKRLLLMAGVALLAMAPVMYARADIIYTLGTNNIPGAADGPGPYGFMQLHKDSATKATFTFFGNSVLLGTFVYSFTEMALNLSLTGFTNIANQITSSAVTFLKTPGANQNPSFALGFGGTMDGFGNFNIHQVVNPNGTSAALSQASFSLTRSLGTWAGESTILASNPQGYKVATHLIYNGFDNGTGFAADNGTINCVPGTCPVINPLADVPEPVSLALLCVGIAGLAFVRKRGSY